MRNPCGPGAGATIVLTVLLILGVVILGLKWTVPCPQPLASWLLVVLCVIAVDMLLFEAFRYSKHAQLHRN
jgi:hypothetical protein